MIWLSERMFKWLRDPRKALRLAQADAEALIRDHGGEANREARQRERDGIALTVAADDGQASRPRYGDPDTRVWRRVGPVVSQFGNLVD